MGSTATYPVNSGTGALELDNRIQLWSSRRQRSQELKQLHEPDWLRYWYWYRNVVEPMSDPADWWRSNESIPTVFKIVETLLPRYVMGMFESPDWFTVEGRHFRSEQYESLVHNLLRTTVDEMGLFPKIYEMLRYTIIMGHSWGKIVWREDYETRQILTPTQLTHREIIENQYGRAGIDAAEEMYGPDILDAPSGQVGMSTEVITEETFNGPDFEWLTLDRVFPDPSGRMRFVIEEIHTTLEELEETQDSLEVYDPEVLAELRSYITMKRAPGETGGLDNLGDARSGTTAGVSIEYAREPETTEGIPEWIVTPMRDGTGVSLWQCWGWVPKNQRGSDDVPWRLLVIAEGKHILRDEPSPTPDGKPPYFPVKSLAIPGVLYGESILKYVGPLSDQQSRLANMRLDEVFLGIWQQYIFRKNAVVSDNAMLMQPGGAIEVNPEPGTSINDTFAVLPRDPLLPQGYQEDVYRQTQAEHAAAATDIMQGVGQGAGSRTTATEVERKLQQGNARHMLQVMYNDYTVKREVLTRVWKWLQMRLTTAKMIRLSGGEGVNVDLSMIQIPVDIVVGGGIFAMSKENRIQMDQELMMMSESPVFGMYMRPHPILVRWLTDRGFKNPDLFVKSEQEVQRAIMEQNQAIAAGEVASDPDQQPVPTNGAGGNGDMQQMLPDGASNQLAGRSLGGGGVPTPTQ